MAEMNDEFRDFAQDLQNQEIAAHLFAIHKAFPTYSLIQDVSNMHIPLVDSVWTDGNSNIPAEHKTDSHDSGNLGIEIFSNVNYFDGVRELTHNEDGSLWKFPIKPGTDRHVLGVACIEIIPEKFRSIGIHGPNIKKHHIGSFLIVPTKTVYVIELEQLHTYLMNHRDSVPLCLGHTRRNSATWWALNWLLPIREAKANNLFIAEIKLDK